MDVSSHESCKMSHIDHKKGTDLIRNLPAALEINDARISRRTHQDHPRPMFTGKTLRAARNEYTDFWEKNPDELQPFPMQVMRSMQDQAMHLGGDESFEIDPSKECYPAGQGVGGITDLVPAGELATRMVAEAAAALGKRPSSR